MYSQHLAGAVVAESCQLFMVPILFMLAARAVQRFLGKEENCAAEEESARLCCTRCRAEPTPGASEPAPGVGESAPSSEAAGAPSTESESSPFDDIFADFA